MLLIFGLLRARSGLTIKLNYYVILMMIMMMIIHVLCYPIGNDCENALSLIKSAIVQRMT